MKLFLPFVADSDTTVHTWSAKNENIERHILKCTEKKMFHTAGVPIKTVGKNIHIKFLLYFVISAATVNVAGKWTLIYDIM